jgi:rod shape-determining protein MreC
MAIRNKSHFHFRLPEFILVLLILVSGVSLGMSSGSFIVNFQRIGYSIVSTVEKGVFTVTDSIKNTFGAVKELSRLKNDYNVLSKKLENYEIMQRSNAEIRKENDQLKEQLGFVQSLSQKNYPAQIISRDVDKLYASITINRGSVNGISKNMPVIAYQNGNIGLVGKIVEVGKFTSIIMPIYSINCTISARIQNTRDLGLITGLGTDSQPLDMKYIKKRVLNDLHYGDIIVTSGENGNYMRDIQLGTISKISVLDYDSSLDIQITPIIDFSRLETVIVVDQRTAESSSDYEPSAFTGQLSDKTENADK